MIFAIGFPLTRISENGKKRPERWIQIPFFFDGFHAVSVFSVFIKIPGRYGSGESDTFAFIDAALLFC